MKNTYKSISSVSKRILSSSEQFEVEFKSSVGGLDSETIVSFANSEKGGTVLLGVEETVDENGKQTGKVIGCKVSDRTKMAILAKAQQCRPPIEIEIIVENESKTPFYRIEIPAGKLKPYCTSGGTYKIREDGNKRPLYPHDLLEIFLKLEAGKFLQNFKSSTEELRFEIEDQNDKLVRNLNHSLGEVMQTIEYMLVDFSDGIADVSKNIKETERQIQYSLEEIVDKSENNEKHLEDLSFDTEQERKENERKDSYINEKLNLLLEHYKIEDPELTRRKTWWKIHIGFTKATYGAQNKKITLREKKKEYKRLSEAIKINRYLNLEEFIKLWDDTPKDQDWEKSLAEKWKTDG